MRKIRVVAQTTSIAILIVLSISSRVPFVSFLPLLLGTVKSYATPPFQLSTSQVRTHLSLRPG